MARSYARIPGMGEWSEDRILTLLDGEQISRAYTLSDATVDSRRLLIARDAQRSLNLRFAVYHVNGETGKVDGACKVVARQQDDLLAILAAQYAQYLPASESGDAEFELEF